MYTIYRLIRVCGGGHIEIYRIFGFVFKLTNFCIIAVFSNVTDNSTCDSEPPAAVRLIKVYLMYDSCILIVTTVINLPFEIGESI